MNANKSRGEVDVSLGGKNYVLVPSFGVLSKIELALGSSCMVLAKRALTVDYSINEIATVFMIAINDKLPEAKQLTIDQVGPMIFDLTIMKAGPILTQFWNLAIVGDTVKKESGG